MSQSEIERRAGDTDAQIRVLREAHEILETLGDRFFFSTVSIWLANALIDSGADAAEIEDLCTAARERTIEGDLANFIGLDWADARVYAAEGLLDDAEATARRALARADETDHFLMRARSRVVLAEVLHRAGRTGRRGVTRVRRRFDPRGEGRRVGCRVVARAHRRDRHLHPVIAVGGRC